MRLVATEYLSLDGVFEEPGLAGSAQLFNACTKENLIDLYRFMVHPVVLGKGERLFNERDRRALELTEVKRFGKGIAVLEYVPAKEQ
jgi:dihydrofolate reductase